MLNKNTIEMQSSVLLPSMLCSRFQFKMVNNNNVEGQRWDLLDSERFRSFFDSDGRLVKEHEFRKAVFKGEPLQ